MWLDEDQDDVLAYLEWERDQCSGCGQQLTDTLAEDAAFVAKSVVCKGCQVKEQLAAQVHADTQTLVREAGRAGAVNEQGRRYYVVPR